MVTHFNIQNKSNYKMRKFGFLYLCFTLFIISSCQKGDGVVYNDVALIINTSCAVTGCHVPPTNAGSLDCSSYSAMKSVLDNGRFNQRVLVNQDMPPGGTLSNSDLDLLRQWRDNQFRE